MGAPLSRAAVAAFLFAAAILGLAVGALTGGGDDDPATASTSTTGGDTGPSATPGADDGGSDDDTDAAGLTLAANATSVKAYDKIEFTGTLTPATEGVTVTLWRQVDGGGWEVFVASGDALDDTTKADGSYKIIAGSGRKGTNEFRVEAEVDGEKITSDAVSVQVS